MARIIGGVGVSHTPTIGFAYDTNKQNDPAWAPIFKGFEPVRAWFKEKRPDALVYIFNDHITSFFFDNYSVFSLGIGEEYKVADEGGGARALPAVPGNPELAAHIGASLVAEEFDMSFFQDKPLDHGFFSPMSVLLERTRRPVADDAGAAAGGRRAVPDSLGGALLQAGPGAAPGDRELSRGHHGRGARDRRALAPGARRALGLQQRRVGQAVPRPDHPRSGAPGGDDASPSTPSSAAGKAPRSSCG